MERVNDIFTVCRVCFDSAGGETESGRRWLFLGVRECHVFTVRSLAHGVSGMRMEMRSMVPEESFEAPVFCSLSSSDLLKELGSRLALAVTGWSQLPGNSCSRRRFFILK